MEKVQKRSNSEISLYIQIVLSLEQWRNRHRKLNAALIEDFKFYDKLTVSDGKYWNLG
jgi:hypothetical protein